MGNALKCIFGYSYALAEWKGLSPPPIIVSSADVIYIVTLKPNRIKAVIESEIITQKRDDNGYTTFVVKFPTNTGADASTYAFYGRPHPSNPLVLKDLVIATYMVNPSRCIRYNIFSEQGVLGAPQSSKGIRNETSVLWYTKKEFESLYDDFLRARPDTPLKDFISLFRGFTSKKIIGEILQTLSSGNHDSGKSVTLQFLPKEKVSELFALMKSKAKPISKRSIQLVLGYVGQEAFERVLEQNGWERLRYVMMPSTRVECPGLYNLYHDQRCKDEDHIEYPYLIELAVFDRKKDDLEGLRVYSCINFMASGEDIFSRVFGINYRLGRIGIKEDSPVTVMVHLVCPVLRWLSHGKSGLDESTIPRTLMEKAFDEILPIPKTPKVYHPPPPKKPLSWIPHGKIGDPYYEDRLKDFANEIRAIDSQRSNLIKYSSRGWCYTIEGLRKINKGEFNSCQKAINDCRKIGLLPIDFVREDQDETRRFQGIINASDPGEALNDIKLKVETFLDALPTHTTDFWMGEEYYVMMCVEKGDLLNLFKPVCNKYHVPIVSSKGWPPILLRAHITTLAWKAETNGLKPVLLLFYDHDPAGLKISNTFRENLRNCERGTGWNPDGLIIERFGLNKEDIDKYGLTWIENLKTGSGRESNDWGYINQFGKKKCESNSLFKNDSTLKAGEEICKKAIEKYYGTDAVERFRKKEESSKEKLGEIYNDPLWENFYARINEMIKNLSANKTSEEIQTSEPKKEVEVIIDDKHYGRCPDCGSLFDYDGSDDGRLVKCRYCSLPMRLRLQGGAR